MEGAKERNVRLLQVMRGPKPEDPGLKIIKVVTTDPHPLTFVFEGTEQALDLDLFEIPVGCYPLRKDDRLLVFPLVAQIDGMRWAAIEKINGGITMATMTAPTSLKIEGIEKTYTAADLIIPPYFAVNNETESVTEPQGTTSGPYLKGNALNIRPLKAGDQVSLGPTLVGEDIKYVILERY